ncbi:hypothetical protein [Streptomyces sp. NPDC001719]
MALNRSWMRSAALAAAVTALVSTAPGPASAHEHPDGPLHCQGTESVDYSPGVTLTPRGISVTTRGRFTECAGGADEVTSGSYGEHFTVSDADCALLLEGFHTQRTFTWNAKGTKGTKDTKNAKGTSVADISGNSTVVAGQVVTTITGTVTEGRYRGRSVKQVIVLPQPGVLECLTTGLTSASGVTTLDIT